MAQTQARPVAAESTADGNHHCIAWGYQEATGPIASCACLSAGNVSRVCSAFTPLVPATAISIERVGPDRLFILFYFKNQGTLRVMDANFGTGGSLTAPIPFIYSSLQFSSSVLPVQNRLSFAYIPSRDRFESPYLLSPSSLHDFNTENSSSLFSISNADTDGFSSAVGSATLDGVFSFPTVGPSFNSTNNPIGLTPREQVPLPSRSIPS